MFLRKIGGLSFSSFRRLFSPRQFFSLSLVFLMLVGIGIGVFALQRSTEMKVGAQGVEMKLLTTTTDISPNINDKLYVDIYLDTKDLKVTAADLKLNYDKSKLEALSIETTGFLPVVLAAGKVDDNLGIASITLGSNPDSPVSGNAVLARLKLKPKETTGVFSTTLSVSSESAIAVLGSDGNMLSNYPSLTLYFGGKPTPTSFPTPSLRPTAIPWPSVYPSPSASPRPQTFIINEVYADSFFVTFKGPYLGGEGRAVEFYITYRYRKSGGKLPDYIPIIGWEWYTYSGRHQVIREGEKEVIRIPRSSLPYFNTNRKISSYRIKINSVDVQIKDSDSISSPTPRPRFSPTPRPRLISPPRWIVPWKWK